LEGKETSICKTRDPKISHGRLHPRSAIHHLTNQHGLGEKEQWIVTDVY